jgi:hypothetical protein
MSAIWGEAAVPFVPAQGCSGSIFFLGVDRLYGPVCRNIADRSGRGDRRSVHPNGLSQAALRVIDSGYLWPQHLGDEMKIWKSALLDDTREKNGGQMPAR